MQFGLLEVGVPLWVAQDTEAPKAIVSALLILNTLIVIAFRCRSRAAPTSFGAPAG